MSIQWATVVPGSEAPAGDGITGALRCVLVLPDQSLTGAILKKVPVEQVYAEVLSALVLRAWSLPVPDPYLVQEGADVWFASADAGYPNLKKRVGLDMYAEGSGAYKAARDLAFDLAKSLPTAPLAAVADEAIDNRDRNLGNILWDGAEEAWIDHAMALGNGDAAGLEDVNKLCSIAVGSGDHLQFMDSVISQWTLLDTDSYAECADALSRYYNTNSWRDLIAARLANLGMRLVSRFPPPPDLFSDTFNP